MEIGERPRGNHGQVVLLEDKLVELDLKLGLGFWTLRFGV